MQSTLDGDLDIDDVCSGHPVAQEELDALRLSDRRYETLRQLNPRQFAELYARSLKTDLSFNQLVDVLDIMY